MYSHFPEQFTARQLIFLALVVFVFCSLLFSSLGIQGFQDADPFWHIATGDWIREHGRIPTHDAWSYTAGDYRWLNVAWAWDIIFSFIVEHWGWYGAIAVNSMIIGGAYALLAALCLKHGASVFALTLVLYATFTVQGLFLRPLQVTHVLLMGWMWILTGTYRGWFSKRWLWILPASVVVWVNMHGGVIMGAILFAAYGVQAVWDKNYAYLKRLIYVSAVCLIAFFCNPYGFDIIETIWRPLNDPAKIFITEWQPIKMQFSSVIVYIYMTFFVLFCIFSRPPMLLAEWGLCILWFCLSMMSMRYANIFVYFSAPIAALQVHSWLKRKNCTPTPLAKKIDATMSRMIDQPDALLIAAIFAIMTIVILPGKFAEKMQGNQTLPPFSMKTELAFIETHYPKLRFFNEYVLGGLIIYDSGGTFPVFIDGRSITSYPESIIGDYTKILSRAPDWEKVLKQHRIDGAIVIRKTPAPTKPEVLARYLYAHFQSIGWKEVFTGENISIFVRPHIFKAHGS